MRVVDLFAGCGGLSLGFIAAGHDIVKAVEFDADIANTYKKNHVTTEMIVDDIKNVDKCGFFFHGDADIIIGGPPCQGFSMAGARIRDSFIDDPRNYLFKHYYNVVNVVQPSAFVMENVKGLLTMQGGQIFSEIVDIFSNGDKDSSPYNIFHKIVRATDYGIPQNRERVIIMGYRDSKKDVDEIWKKTKEEVSFNDPHFFDNVTVRDAISNLPSPTVSGVVKNVSPISNYQKELSSSQDTICNHCMTKHSSKAIERMTKITAGENYTSLNETIKSVHSGAYGRLEWDEPAQTITTRFDTPSGGRFIHPVENRTLTPREAARIQSFPDDFVFYGNRTSICKQIGNAVPPKLAYFLAKVVEKLV